MSSQDSSPKAPPSVDSKQMSSLVKDAVDSGEVVVTDSVGSTSGELTTPILSNRSQRRLAMKHLPRSVRRLLFGRHRFPMRFYSPTPSSESKKNVLRLKLTELGLKPEHFMNKKERQRARRAAR